MSPPNNTFGTHDINAEAHLARLRTIVNREQTEGRDGLFFKGRLPLELFLRVIEFAGQPVRMSQVCGNWRKSIIACPRLWRVLDEIELMNASSVKKVQTFASRSKGRLERVNFVLDLEEKAGFENSPYVLTFRQILHEIVRRDGARRLKQVRFDLVAYRDQSEFDQTLGYQALSVLANFLDYGAVNVEKLIIDTGLNEFPAGTFALTLPKLKQLLVHGSTWGYAHFDCLPEVFKSPVFAPKQMNLVNLNLCGIALIESNFPEFPKLETLKVIDCRVDNLYGLLSRVRLTVKKICLADIQTKPIETFLPNPVGGGVKDMPPTLEFLHLDEVHVARGCPSLWTAPQVGLTHFMICCPAVRIIRLGECSFSWSRWVLQVGETNIDSWCELTTTALATLLRHSPNLMTLDLGCAADDYPAVCENLVYAGPNLSALHLGSGATDAVIDQLPRYVPNLNHLFLDAHDSIVSLPALARMAENLRKSASAKSKFPRSKLRLTTVRPAYVRQYDQSLAQLRMKLRNLLLGLSPTQVNHLTSSLTLNNVPNFSVSFDAVKQEIESIAAEPTALEPETDRFGNPKKICARPAGEKSIVEAAKAAMNAWQRKREDEWAIEYFKLNKIELDMEYFASVPEIELDVVNEW